jgi:hypothetical protein
MKKQNKIVFPWSLRTVHVGKDHGGRMEPSVVAVLGLKIQNSYWVSRVDG